ncbi:MAG: transcriptional repressor NrdR [Planctomycetes bacterium]|nr:transcriptional repressor NrdR [Planctomycetota bacterium]
MHCPYCARDKDKVIDSRPSDSGDAIRRRRECIACGKRFTTYERVERTERLMVVKRDGTRVPFNPDNIMRGISSACGKRPVPASEKERVVREVEEEMHREFEREVPSRAIGKRVAEKLRSVDHISYIRFASEYYQFSTVGEIQREIDDLADRPAPAPGHPDLFGS